MIVAASNKHGITSRRSRSRARSIALLRGAVLLVGVAVTGARAQDLDFSLQPMRMDVEVPAGTEKTVAFEIKAAPSEKPTRGHLVLNLADWMIKDDGSVTYGEAESMWHSATPWLKFSPASVTLEPGRVQLVRLTAAAPAEIAPGTYRAAVFVQERPEAALPKGEERVVAVRVRFAFTLYLVVPPVAAEPSFADFAVDTKAGKLRLTCEMLNQGTRHVRPLVIWSVRPPAQDSDFHGRIDSTVLLPDAHMRESYMLPASVSAPGEYEVSVMVDFQDGKPMQSISKRITVPGESSEETLKD